jgi:Ca-activated chloride channel family protein
MKRRFPFILWLLVIGVAACTPALQSAPAQPTAVPQQSQQGQESQPDRSRNEVAESENDTEAGNAPPSQGVVVTQNALITATPGGAVAVAPTQEAIGLAPIAESTQASDLAMATPAPTAVDMFFEDYGVNPFLDTEDDNLSTFAMDVDTASYTLTRNYLMQYGQMPPADAIRPEEFVNYFDAGYESPPDDVAFSVNLDMVPTPFGYDGHYLLRVGIQGQYIPPEDRDPALLIFVIDVSGSMDMENRLQLVKEALALLIGELREDDRIGIVVYSDNSRVVLDPTPASEDETILTAINNLQPEGSTNAEAGLQLGYQMALANMRAGGTTRIILCSDGVANVGATGPDAILQTIAEGVESGITLTTVGFGMGNFNDVLMEQLANDGNGSYFYVDNLREARRVFVYNLTGTLQVIAYDARVQVDFTPSVTDRYRLIGYENRAIADEDFRDDTVDAGEVGAGHSITALYELALEEGALDNPEGIVATVYVRYQDAETRQVVETSQTITVAQIIPNLEDAPPTFLLQAAVAEFAELLRGSYWAQDGSYADLRAFTEALPGELTHSLDVADFMAMVRIASRLAGE